MVDRSLWIGFDPREAAAFAVARHTALKLASEPLAVYGLVLDELRAEGLYRRPTEIRNNRLFDVISNHPMSTEFAISRFLVPYLTGYRGVAMFQDCDMLNRCDLVALMRDIDPTHAVTVVKHQHVPSALTKMDNQIQSRYARKNWSSVMIFQCEHPSNKKLTPDLVNSLPGRDLHAFCWLDDDEIGEMSVDFNWLVGHSPKVENPGIVHFTDGIPTMPGYENVAYSTEWRSALRDWASRRQ